MLIHIDHRASVSDSPWVDLFTGADVPNPTSETSSMWSMTTDGEYVFLMFRDASPGNYSFSSMIKTYSQQPNGDLVEVGSQNFINHANDPWGEYLTMIVKSGKMYVGSVIGMSTFDIAANGTLTEVSYSQRVTTGIDHSRAYSGALIHDKFLVLTTSSTNSSIIVADERNTISCYPVFAGANHGAVVYSGGTAYSWYQNVATRNDKIYATGHSINQRIPNVVTLTLSDTGVFSDEASHQLPADSTTGTFLVVIGERLYFYDVGLRVGPTYKYGYFPINQDGSLGARVDDVRWHDLIPESDWALYRLHSATARQISLGSYDYRADSNILQRRG